MILPLRLSAKGPLIDYLMDLQARGAVREVEEAKRAVRAVVASPEGRILMELLEKATTLYALDPLANPCALAALNAQRFIPLDLKRIASDESDGLLGEGDAGSAGHGRREPGRRSAGRGF